MRLPLPLPPHARRVARDVGYDAAAVMYRSGNGAPKDLAATKLRTDDRPTALRASCPYDLE